LFHEDFDVPSLGRFVLGRLSQIMTEQEQQEFLGLFENYVVATYSDRLSEYVANGAVPRVIGSRLDPDGAIVSSEFNRGSWPSTAGAIRVDLATDQARLHLQDQRRYYRWSQHGGERARRTRRCGGT
jgi:ABC-type transporter MlaC component